MVANKRGLWILLEKNEKASRCAVYWIFMPEKISTMPKEKRKKAKSLKSTSLDF